MTLHHLSDGHRLLIVLMLMTRMDEDWSRVFWLFAEFLAWVSYCGSWEDGSNESGQTPEVIVA